MTQSTLPGGQAHCVLSSYPPGSGSGSQPRQGTPKELIVESKRTKEASLRKEGRGRQHKRCRRAGLWDGVLRKVPRPRPHPRSQGPLWAPHLPREPSTLGKLRGPSVPALRVTQAPHALGLAKVQSRERTGPAAPGPPQSSLGPHRPEWKSRLDLACTQEPRGRIGAEGCPAASTQNASCWQLIFALSARELQGWSHGRRGSGCSWKEGEVDRRWET